MCALNGGFYMSKRDFLKKGASLVGGATLLGGAFAQSGNVNADVYKDMLDASWKYTFAKILAFFWMTSWKKSIEKETKGKALAELESRLDNLIDHEFNMNYRFDQDDGQWLVRLKYNTGETYVIKRFRTDEGYPTYQLFIDSSMMHQVTLGGVDNLKEAQSFFDEIDYIVTSAKLQDLCEGRSDLLEKNSRAIEGQVITRYKPQKGIYLFVRGKKVKEITPPFDVLSTEDGFLGKMSITFEDGTSLSYGAGMSNTISLPKMTKYMKEIIEQVDRIKVPGDIAKNEVSGKKYVSLGDDKY